MSTSALITSIVFRPVQLRRLISTAYCERHRVREHMSS